jgi:hypothetical protein
MAIFSVIDTGTLADTFYEGMVKDAANWAIMEAAKPAALGTANYKNYVNAAGTSQEWAYGIKSGTFTREMDAASGATAEVNCGFVASIVIIIAAGPIAGEFSLGLFSYDGGGFSIYDNANVSAGTWVHSTSEIVLVESAGKSQVCAIASSTNGFTPTWARNGVTASGTATIDWVAIR